MKKVKLLVIELNYHFEVIYNFCTMLGQMESVETTILTTKQVLRGEKLSEKFSDLTWVVLEQMPKQIEAIEPVLARADVVFFNTIEHEVALFDNYDFKGKKVIARVHNANTFFLDKINYRLTLTPFQIWKDTSHFIRKTWLEQEEKKRKALLSKVDFFCFPDEAMKQFALQKGFIKPENTLKTLPLVSFDPKNFKVAESENVIVTIPGAVDPRRKDYEIVERLIRSIELNTPVEIHFLGRMKDKKAMGIAGTLKKIPAKNVRLVFYEGYIAQHTFDEVMEKTNFLLLPINISTRFHLHRETYGQTKISGSINDAIKYGKPAILPEAYLLNEQVSLLFEQYTDDESLKRVFTDWVENKTFLERTGKVEEMLQPYTLGAIATTFEQELLEITS